jgi:hypothetical protein
VNSRAAFTAAAQRISAALARHDDRAVAGPDYATVKAELGRILFIRFRSLGPDEILDFVDESIARLVRESRRRGEALENAAGWLVRVGGNLAKDRFRVLSHETDAEPDGVEEDETVDVIGRQTSEAMVDAALKRAIAAGDATTVKIITDWRDLTDETGLTPSSRDVAARSGYSHTTVNEALASFKSYLEDEGGS